MEIRIQLTPLIGIISLMFFPFLTHAQYGSGYHAYEDIQNEIAWYGSLFKDEVEQFRVSVYRDKKSEEKPEITTLVKLQDDDDSLIVVKSDVLDNGDTIHKEIITFNKKGKITRIVSAGMVFTRSGYTEEWVVKTFTWRKDQLQHYLVIYPEHKDTVYELNILWDARELPYKCYYTWSKGYFRQDWNYDIAGNLYEVNTFEKLPTIDIWVARSTTRYKYRKRKRSSEIYTPLKGSPETTKYMYDAKGRLIRKKIYGITYLRIDYNAEGFIDSRYENGMGSYEYQY